MDEAVAKLKRPESVLVVVYTHGGEVLMMERSHPKGFWQSVTGSLEWSESVLHAAKRELREETGLISGGLIDLKKSTCFRIRPPWQQRYAKEHKWNHEHWFALALPQRRMIHLNGEEHRQYRWIPWQKALRQASSYTNRNCIQYIFR